MRCAGRDVVLRTRLSFCPQGCEGTRRTCGAPSSSRGFFLLEHLVVVKMPGLINQSSHCPLLLTASEVTSCVSGYALGMTASLTYRNLQAQPCKGK